MMTSSGLATVGHDVDDRTAGDGARRRCGRADPLTASGDRVDNNSVTSLLERWARETPNSVAIIGVQPSLTVTYGELRDRAFGLAADLLDRGVGRKDVVLVSMPAGPEYLVAILGCMAIGVCAPVNPAYTVAELSRYAADSGAAAVVTDGAEGGSAGILAAELGLSVVRPGRRSAAAPHEPLSTADAALLLHTAGTTARPKQVPLSHANLLAAAANVVSSLSLTPADRCLDVMPLFHSHGLIGAALASLVAGGSVVCTPGVDPRRVVQWAQDTECTWYTAAPTVHRLVLGAPGDWKGFRLLRSASAPLPPQLAEQLERRFDAPMIEVYGMTESYQIAANPLPPGERRRGSVGLATGTQIAVLDASGEVQTHGEGEVLVRGAALFGGYSVPSEANDDAFVGSWFRTGDMGRIDDDGYLFITGRVKDQINRAGEKISPREVEEAILDHPDVVDVLVFGVPDEVLGEDVGCAVVTASGSHLDPGDLRVHLRPRLASFKVPRQVVSVKEIPKSETGKPLRRAFVEEFMARTEGRQHPTALSGAGPADADVLTRLARIWQTVLFLDSPPRPDDSFFDLGGDSLAVMAMVVEIEEAFGVDLPLVDVHSVPTFAELAARVQRLASVGPDDSLLRSYQRGGGETSLVLVPGQFGLAVGLNRIADAVGAGPDIYLFDYPGHRVGQVPLETISGIADHLLGAIEQAQLRGRLVLYGNSMGGWVALEAARRLEARGHPPLLVGIGDMYSPAFNVDTRSTRPTARVMARNLVARARRRLRGGVSAAGGAVRGAAELRADAVQRASDRARRAYRPHPYGGDLAVFVTPARGSKFGETLGYERHVTGRLISVQVTGEHSTMHVEQAVPIGRWLGEAIDSMGSRGTR
jgi:acyl-CoA synthetase (AMP-forming)/AMP-acid ligase II/thioesterase domain-containing protein/acyl carrier protein